MIIKQGSHGTKLSNGVSCEFEWALKIFKGRKLSVTFGGNGRHIGPVHAYAVPKDSSI